MRSQPVAQRTRIYIVRAGALVFGTLLLLTHPAMVGHLHESVERASVVLVLACIVGRMWSILYVGSRKNRELVSAGPYSMSRNPLYFFSTIGAVGIGLMHGSVVVALLLGLFTYLVFLITATKEAEHLQTLFGSRYEAYAHRRG